MIGGGGRTLGVTVQHPAQIQNTPINIAGRKDFSESYSLFGNLNRNANFLQISRR